MPHATITGRAIRVRFANGTERVVQQIVIDCPACGQGEIQIEGHHIRAVAELLMETAMRFPELCGSPEKQSDNSLSGVVDPGKVQLN